MKREAGSLALLVLLGVGVACSSTAGGPIARGTDSVEDGVTTRPPGEPGPAVPDYTSEDFDARVRTALEADSFLGPLLRSGAADSGGTNPALTSEGDLLGGATYVTFGEPTDLPAGRFMAGPAGREGETPPTDDAGRPVLQDLSDGDRTGVSLMLVIVEMGESDQIRQVSVLDRAGEG